MSRAPEASITILGISAFYHDSAAAIIVDGNIVAAAQEERFTRRKHDASFPVHAVKYCLEEAGKSLNDLSAVVFYDKPFLKFERLLETYNAYAPKGLSSFITSMPVWLKEKMFLKKLIYDELKNVQEYDKKQFELLFPEHHLSHAASAFYPSPYENAAIMTIDGVGEWATASICKGEGEKITILKELRFPHSIGLLYSAFTYYLGFKVNSGEYKLMGLAPYGDPESEETKKFTSIIRDQLITIYEDGSIWLNQSLFDYATGLKMTNNHRWEKLFGVPQRNPESGLEQVHCNMALAIQQVTEEVVLKMARHAKALTGADTLCLAGGVALNCVANGLLERERIFDHVYIQPAAGDAGGALGAALCAYHIYFEQPRQIDTDKADAMNGAYLGPEVHAPEIKKVTRKYNAVAHKRSGVDELTKEVAEHLSYGEVVGWVQGRMEFGPRALGNRSILADPRSDESQKKVNLKIKYRESFRPFAPSVLEEKAHDYFEMNSPSPYMLLVHPVKTERRKSVPEDYNQLSVKEKLYHSRSDIPAVTHIDYSARIQTVSADTNPRYHQLISAFEKLTGYGLVVNTSFNVRGEPIVNTAEDAYRCFMRTEMDILVIGDYIFYKAEQPEWPEKDSWKTEFVLD